MLLTAGRTLTHRDRDLLLSVVFAVFFFLPFSQFLMSDRNLFFFDYWESNMNGSFVGSIWSGTRVSPGRTSVSCVADLLSFFILLYQCKTVSVTRSRTVQVIRLALIQTVPSESMSKTQERGLNKGCSVLQATPALFDEVEERLLASTFHLC